MIVSRVVKEQIGEKIIETAELIFEYCTKDKDDFCIQNVHDNSVVFGSINRVIFHIHCGWIMEESYCTENFKKKFNQIVYHGRLKYYDMLDGLIDDA